MSSWLSSARSPSSVSASKTKIASSGVSKSSCRVSGVSAGSNGGPSATSPAPGRPLPPSGARPPSPSAEPQDEDQQAGRRAPGRSERPSQRWQRGKGLRRAQRQAPGGRRGDPRRGFRSAVLEAPIADLPINCRPVRVRRPADEAERARTERQAPDERLPVGFAPLDRVGRHSLPRVGARPQHGDRGRHTTLLRKSRRTESGTPDAVEAVASDPDASVALRSLAARATSAQRSTPISQAIAPSSAARPDGYRIEALDVSLGEPRSEPAEASFLAPGGSRCRNDSEAESARLQELARTRPAEPFIHGVVHSAPAETTRNPDMQGFLRRKADARIRTADPFITSEVLYQLSYVGVALD